MLTDIINLQFIVGGDALLCDVGRKIESINGGKARFREKYLILCFFESIVFVLGIYLICM